MPALGQERVLVHICQTQQSFVLRSDVYNYRKITAVSNRTTVVYSSLNPTPMPYPVACAGPGQEAHFHPKLKKVKPRRKVYVFLTVLLPFHQVSRNISVREKRARPTGCWHKRQRRVYIEEEKLCNPGAGHWKLLWKGSHRAMALPGPICALFWELMIPSYYYCPATLSYLCFWSHCSGSSKVGWVRKHAQEKNNHLSHSAKGYKERTEWKKRRCFFMPLRFLNLKSVNIKSEEGQSSTGGLWRHNRISPAKLQVFSPSSSYLRLLNKLLIFNFIYQDENKCVWVILIKSSVTTCIGNKLEFFKILFWSLN